MNVEQDEVKPHSATLKNNSDSGAGDNEEEVKEPVFGFTPEREFFFQLGEVHNACLDYLVQEQLPELPRAIDGYYGLDVLPLELNLLKDFVFHYVVDYLDSEYGLSEDDLVACGTYLNFYVDEKHDYLNNPILAPTDDLRYYWLMARDIVQRKDLGVEEMMGQLGALLESSYDVLMSEGITADEFTFMAYLGITRSSILYWNNDDNMIAYNEVYWLSTDFEITQAKRSRFWGADGRGAIAGGIGAIASGCWALVPLVAIISSAIAAINEAISQADLYSWEQINAGQPVDLSSRTMVYIECTEDFHTEYNLFDATTDPLNPYNTRQCQNIILPKEHWFYH